jgi:hypothetical protein
MQRPHQHYRPPEDRQQNFPAQEMSFDYLGSFYKFTFLSEWLLLINMGPIKTISSALGFKQFWL